MQQLERMCLAVDDFFELVPVVGIRGMRTCDLGISVCFWVVLAGQEFGRKIVAEKRRERARR